MRLLLIQPPAQPPGDRSVLLPPLGLAYLAAVAREAGHAVDLIDARAARMNTDALRAAAPAGRYDLIGLTGTSPAAEGLAAAAAALHGRSHALVAGGPHATAAPEALFRAAPQLDWVLRGEAEESLLEALEALEQGGGALDAVEGLARPEAPGRIRAPVAELDRLPWPARELLPVEVYRHPLARARPLASLISSRGCEHSCLFCDRSVSGRRWRARSAGAVVAEMLALAAEGYGELMVYDDDFLADDDRANEIAEALAVAGAPLPWSCEARPVARAPELYTRLRAAGCRRIAFGVDAGTAAGQQELSKRLDLGEVAGAFAAARAAGLETLAYFVIGLQSEPPGQAHALMRAREIDPDYVQFSALSPYPGSPLFKLATDRGLLADDPRARGPADLGHTRQYVALGGWDGPQLSAALARAYAGFYGRPGYLLRRLARLRSTTELIGLGRGAMRLAAWRTSRGLG